MMNARAPKILTLAVAAYCLIAVGHAVGADDFTLSWSNNMLTVRSPRMPGEKVETLWLEAFCRKGSTNRTWDKTTIPHTTKLVSAADDQKSLVLASVVDGKVAVRHEIRAVDDGVEYRLTLQNQTEEAIDIDWAQPCMRVGRFAQRKQEDYWPK